MVRAGLDYTIEGDTLTVGPVPYRLKSGALGHGELICHVEREGARLSAPSDHTVGWVAEERPHTRSGDVLEKLIHQDGPQEWANGTTSICGMSRKAHEHGYKDYGEKMLAYARLIAKEAGRNWKRDSLGSGVVKDGNNMVDQEIKKKKKKKKKTGLTRSMIGEKDKLFRQERLAVIGAGGTGGFIVDMIAKCNVASIDIYDDDVVSQHTQLRWPGVVNRNVVEEHRNKAEYLAQIYASRTNRNIRGHALRVGGSNLTYFVDKTMVFVAVDRGPDRRDILTGLTGLGVNFIDCGIDMRSAADGLTASVRVVRTAFGDDREKRMELVQTTPDKDAGEGMYEAAIQTSEINALNATLAVIAWKQGIGFYKDAFKYRRMRLHAASTTWAGYDGAAEDIDYEH